MQADGEIFGKYIKEKDPIGEGAFGTVYQAIDTESNQPVALKILDPLLMRDRKWVGRFRQEAQVMAQLDHPHIVPMYDTGTENGRLFIAMKLIEGGDLAKHISKQGRISWSETIEIASQVAQAIDYAHSKNVVHHDLKPSNILLIGDDPNEPFTVLTDFGLSLLASENTMSVSLKSYSGGMMGSPAYMAPEIWRGEKVTGAVDLYALACLIYEMLTGRKLFNKKGVPAIMRAHLDGPEFAEEWPVDVPRGIAPVLLKALVQSAGERYQSCQEFVMALRSLEYPQEEEETKNSNFLRRVGGGMFLAVTAVIGMVWGIGDLLGMPQGDNSTPVADVSTLSADVAILTATTDFLLAETPTVTPTVPIIPTQTPSPTATVFPTLTPRATPTPELEAGDLLTISLPTGEVVMMVFVPEGEMMMGSDAEGENSIDELEPVVVIDFLLDQTEVTNKQFSAFVENTGHVTLAEATRQSVGYDGTGWRDDIRANWQNPQGLQSDIEDLEDHPVVHVSWYDANEFCEWRDARLPTELEWERAARGIEEFIYPWGNEFDGTKLNYCDANCPFDWNDETSNDGDELTAPVGSYPTGNSPYGVQDMAGNVWEWTSSIDIDDSNEWEWTSLIDIDRSSEDNDEGSGTSPSNTDLLVVRGGSWYSNDSNVGALVRNRYYPIFRAHSVGFRCAKDIP